jgi:hypothetical protein
MKRFSGLILLLARLLVEGEKDVKNYWATDPTVTTPVFSETMSWN